MKKLELVKVEVEVEVSVSGSGALFCGEACRFKNNPHHCMLFGELTSLDAADQAGVTWRNRKCLEGDIEADDEESEGTSDVFAQARKYDALTCMLQGRIESLRRSQEAEMAVLVSESEALDSETPPEVRRLAACARQPTSDILPVLGGQWPPLKR